MKIVIFGSSGDLAKRKLFPALHTISKTHKLTIIAYSRSKTQAETIQQLQEFHTYTPSFLNNIHVLKGEYNNLTELHALTDKHTVYYCSVPAVVYPEIFSALTLHPTNIVILEKPFGSDLQSFLELKDVLKHKRVYLIDHYLLKPTALAIPEFTKEHQKIHDLINSNNLKSAQIIFKEELGLEGRMFFDQFGMLKDVVQNHMLMLYALVLSDKITQRKSILKNIEQINIDKCLFGQYNEYTTELGRHSDTETFCLVPLYNQIERYKNVPFIISAGKGLNKKECEIKFQFKKEAFREVSQIIKEYTLSEEEVVVNMNDILYIELVFDIGARKDIFFRIRIKDEDKEYVVYSKEEVDKVITDRYGKNRDYEIVFASLCEKVSFPTAEMEEVEILWRIFDPVLGRKKNSFNYKKGVDMPEAVSKHIDAYM